MLRAAGVGGPYAIALGARCYTGVIETTERGGYPVLRAPAPDPRRPGRLGPGRRRRRRAQPARRRLRAGRRRGPLDRLPGPRRRDGHPLPRGEPAPSASTAPRPPSPDLLMGVGQPGECCPAGPGHSPVSWSVALVCARHPAEPFESHEQRSARAHVLPESQRDRARLARRRRRRPGPRSRGHRGGPHPARQAQADLRAAHRHRRPRDHHQRRQDRADVGQGRRRRWSTATRATRAASASRTYGDLLEKKPQEAVRRSIRGMLPKNRLGRAQISKLKVYAGPTHPHAAQQPQPLALEQARARSWTTKDDERWPSPSPRPPVAASGPSPASGSVPAPA